MNPKDHYRLQIAELAALSQSTPHEATYAAAVEATGDQPQPRQASTVLNSNRNGFIPRFEPRAKATLHGKDLDALVFDTHYSQSKVLNKFDGLPCEDVQGPFDGFQFISYMNKTRPDAPYPEFAYFTVAGPELKWKDVLAATTMYCRITGDIDHCSIEGVQIVRVDEYADHFYRSRGTLAPKDYPPLRIAVCHILLGS